MKVAELQMAVTLQSTILKENVKRLIKLIIYPSPRRGRIDALCISKGFFILPGVSSNKSYTPA
jgi:hypothetical protein